VISGGDYWLTGQSGPQALNIAATSGLQTQLKLKNPTGTGQDALSFQYTVNNAAYVQNGFKLINVDTNSDATSTIMKVLGGTTGATTFFTMKKNGEVDLTPVLTAANPNGLSIDMGTVNDAAATFYGLKVNLTGVTAATATYLGLFLDAGASNSKFEIQRSVQVVHSCLSGTTVTPYILNHTWNNVASTFQSFQIKYTDSASGASSKPFAIYGVNGATEEFSINKRGGVAITARTNSASDTGNNYGLSISHTHNEAGTAHTGLKIQVTRTASTSSLVYDFYGDAGAQSYMTYNGRTVLKSPTTQTSTFQVLPTWGTVGTTYNGLSVAPDSATSTITSNFINCGILGIRDIFTVYRWGGIRIVGTSDAINADYKYLDIAGAWNNAAVTFTGIKQNITDTASAIGSLLLDLQVGSVSRLTIGKTGNTTLTVPSDTTNVTALTINHTWNNGATVFGGIKYAATQTAYDTTSRLISALGGAAGATDRFWVTAMGRVGITTDTLTTANPVLDITSTWNNAAVVFYGLKMTITPTARDFNSQFLDFSTTTSTASFKMSIHGGLTTTCTSSSGGAFNVNHTWNNAGVQYFGARILVTDTSSLSTSLLQDWSVGAVPKAEIRKDGALALGATGSWGSGTGAVIFVKDCTLAPSANPTAGGLLYVESGVLKYRGSSGTVTTIASA
jgi:hypothetical protein